MRLARLALIAVASYIFGYYLGTALLHAETLKNERIHLNSHNTVLIRGVIDSDSVLSAQLDLAKLVAIRGLKDYPIYIVLDSPGGDIEAGIAFIEFAKVIDDVRTVTIFAASMAAMTVETLPGERLITNNGILMFHRASGQISGQFETGELESRLEFFKQQVRGLETMIADRLKLPLLIYKAKIHDELWLNAKSSLKEKAADKVVDIVCSDELTNKRTSVVEESFFGSQTLTFSGCPTMRSAVRSEAPKN